MPKDKIEKSLSFKNHRASPYPCTSKNSEYYKFKEIQLKPNEFDKEWEDARCPVCMEHPHNAVLLLCSSNGCRPYMCDTSYRHSNCLDQFIKSSPATSTEESGPHLTNFHGRKLLTNLMCPLCRGEINGLEVVEPARKFMNLKQRSCSTETCDFSGNYSELRKHARLQHSSVRPSEVDPGRQLDWTRLMRQRDFDDVLSAYQSPFVNLLRRDVRNYGLGDLADFLNTIEWGPVNLFLNFELDFTFFSPSSATDNVEGPSIGGSLSYTQDVPASHVEPAPNNNHSVHVEPAPSNNPSAHVEPAPSNNPSAHVEPAPSNNPLAHVEPAPSNNPSAHVEPAPSNNLSAQVEPAPSNNSSDHMELAPIDSHSGVLQGQQHSWRRRPRARDPRPWVRRLRDPRPWGGSPRDPRPWGRNPRDPRPWGGSPSDPILWGRTPRDPRPSGGSPRDPRPWGRRLRDPRLWGRDPRLLRRLN